MKEIVVCFCANVTEEEIKARWRVQPELKKMDEEALESLDIGLRCKDCLNKDCEIIDKHYSEIIE